MGNERTKHILDLFRLFYYCETVSYNLIREYISEKEAGKKTIRRYIRLLEDAGLLRLRYSKAERAYIPVDGSFVPPYESLYPAKLPDKKPQKLYMEKIIRLCTLIKDVVTVYEEEPVEWYREKYPELSERTRQRDFNELREAGFDIKYCPQNDFGDPARYYYDFFDGI